MTGWIYSGNKKRHFRKLNKVLRQMNQNIKEDTLWRGRFYVKPIGHQWYRFEDGSGWNMYVVVRFIDRVSGITWDVGNDVNSFCFGAKIWRLMNEFITERAPTWSQEPRPGTAGYKEMTEKYIKEGWPHRE